MNSIINLFTALIIAAWMVSLSVLSIQNITPVSLKFLTFESIKLPFGILLSFSAATGVLLGAIAPLFWTGSRPANRRRLYRPEEDFDEFDF